MCVRFSYSVLKWLRTKILNENWRYRVAKKRPKLFWILNWSPETRYISSGKGSLLTNILYPNCAEKNETVVRKILEVKESFESSRVHWSQERWDKVRKKYMYWRRNSQQQTTFHSVWWSTSTASALFNDFRRWKGILNCFSVDENLVIVVENHVRTSNPRRPVTVVLKLWI